MKTSLWFPFLLILLRVDVIHAGSGTWILNPVSGDWNTSANWSSNTVPNGLDTATFGISNQSNISLSASVSVIEIVFSAGASSYTITSPPGLLLTFSSIGIDNESGAVQNFTATVDEEGNAGGYSFHSSSKADDLIVFTTEGPKIVGGYAGNVQFQDFASAGNATFINKGGVTSGAGGGELDFFGAATANTASIMNEAGVTNGAGGGTTIFWFGTGAHGATITCEGATVSGASGGTTNFINNSHAGRATLIANGGTNGGNGGVIEFKDKATGGRAQVKVYGNALLDISAHDKKNNLEIGSLEGDGQVFLGSHQLDVGSNNQSITFSGIIMDTGSLAKIGSGTLTLAGESTYSGGTIVDSGTLLISNTTGSGTGAGVVRVYAGTLGGNGTIAGPVRIGPGTGAGAFLAPGTDGTGTLTIQKKLTFNADGTYECEVDTVATESDQVAAKGATVNTGAQFDLTTIGSQKLTAGMVFTVIDNRSRQPISGTFANLPDGGTITRGSNTFQANYEGGDGNDLTLTLLP